jgi:hypothetical protein
MKQNCRYRLIGALGSVPKEACFQEGIIGSARCRVVAFVIKTLIFGIILGITGLAGGPPAAAQGFVANSGGGVAMALPGFEAPGVKSGDFLLTSQVSSGVAYDSNLLRTQSGVVQDYIFFVTPSFSLMRDGGNHLEEIFASVTSAKYASSEADDFTNVNVRASETYLLSPGSRLLASVSFVDGYERRTTSDHDVWNNPAALIPATPVHQQALLTSIGYRKSWQSIDIGATLMASRQTYDDVRAIPSGVVPQTQRDEKDLALETFLNIRLSQRIQSYLAATVGSSDVRDQTRSSDQWRLSDATTFNITSKTSVGFLVAVREQDYYNNLTLPTRPLYEYEISLSWSPTQRGMLTARGGYHDLGVNYTTGYLAGGGEGWYGSVDLRYQIWRNLLFASSFNYEKAEITGGQGDLASIAAQANLTYEFSSHAGVSILYTLQKLGSNSPEQFIPYNENVFQTSLNLRF